MVRVDFRLAEEGMLASERVTDQVGITSTYQRLMDGELYKVYRVYQKEIVSA